MFSLLSHAGGNSDGLMNSLCGLSLMAMADTNKSKSRDASSQMLCEPELNALLTVSSSLGKNGRAEVIPLKRLSNVFFPTVF